MSIIRVSELPKSVWRDDIVLDKITTKRDSQGILSAVGGTALIKEELFFRISDYTRSQPTAPSVGRIYRKALNWPALQGNFRHGEDPNWYFYLCVPTPDPRPMFAKSVDHVPFKVEFL